MQAAPWRRGCAQQQADPVGWRRCTCSFFAMSCPPTVGATVPPRTNWRFRGCRTPTRERECTQCASCGAPPLCRVEGGPAPPKGGHSKAAYGVGVGAPVVRRRGPQPRRPWEKRADCSWRARYGPACGAARCCGDSGSPKSVAGVRGPVYRQGEGNKRKWRAGAGVNRRFKWRRSPASRRCRSSSGSLRSGWRDR